MFESILGQKHAAEILAKYVKSGDVPPALLFLGPSGVGRKTMAAEFARILNCESAVAPCGSCRSCALMSADSHPSCFTIDFEWQKRFLEKELKEISIHTVREIQRQLSLKISFGKKRIVIIAASQRLSSEAANALLKTLEEPPDNTTIILISNSKKQLPPTVVSRCQLVPFSFLSRESVRGKLKEMKKELTEEEIDFFSEISEGSLSKAIRYLEKWEDYNALEKDFEMLDLKAFKDVELNEFLDYLAARRRKKFTANPDEYFFVWESLGWAKNQNSMGVNKNMILTELHTKLL